MFNDKEKQKESNKAAAKAYRERAKGMTQGMTINEGMTAGMTPRKFCAKTDLPGDDNYVGCCVKDNDGDWQVDNDRPADQAGESMLSKAYDTIIHCKGISQQQLHKHDEQAQANMRSTPLKTLGAFIPCWREQQDKVKVQA